MVRHRRETPFPWMFYAFGAFIVFCGLTHLMEWITTFHPVYRLSGLVKAATAVVSWVALAGLIRIAPKALSLRSPAELEAEIAERRRVAEEREQLLARERAAREKCEGLLEAIPDAVVMADQDGKIELVNRRVEELFGYRRDELIGQPATMLIPEAPGHGDTAHRPEDAGAPVARPMGNGHPLTARRKDGSEFVVESSFSPFRTEEGLLAITAFRDVTARTRAESRHRVLAAASHTLGEARLDWVAVVQSFVEIIAREVGDLCLLRMVSPDGQWLDPVAVMHRDPERLHAIRELVAAEPLRMGEGLAGQAAETGESFLLPEISAEQLETTVPRAYHPYAARFGFHSAVAVPLICSGKVVGTLFASRDRPGQPYVEDDLRLMQDLAARAAIAIENARLHEDTKEAQKELAEILGRESRIAAELQECFRSSFPARVPGYDLGHAYQAALDEASIGGDFYDLFPLGPNLYGVLMGDVSGKGLDAAVVTVKTRYFLRGYAAQHEDPARVVRLVNEVLCDELRGSAFVTLFYGVLDTAAHRLTYVTAGHELPLLLLPDGSLSALETTGPLVGVEPELQYEARTVALPPEAALLLYTDGVTEARRQGRFLGRDGLAKLFARRASADSGAFGASGQILLDWLLSDVEAFAGGHFRDDIALILLQRCP